MQEMEKYSLTVSLAFFSFACVCVCIFICRKQLYAWLNEEINLPARALHLVVYFVAFRKPTSWNDQIQDFNDNVSIEESISTSKTFVAVKSQSRVHSWHILKFSQISAPVFLYRWSSRYVIAAMLVDENKRFLISSFCSSTSYCTLQHCYLRP